MTLLQSEIRRALRSPMLWVWASFSAAWYFIPGSEMLPDWSNETVAISSALLWLAIGVMMEAWHAAGRDRPMAQILDAVPVHGATRTWAAQLAWVIVGGLMAALLTGGVLLSRLLQGPVVGRFSVAEAATGIAAVMVAAVTGAVLARWIPTMFAPMTVLFLVWWVQGVNRARGEAWSWLGLVNTRGLEMRGAGLIGRPAEWHLGYLIGLVALLGSLALLRYGIRPIRAGVALGALVLVTTAGSVVVDDERNVALNYDDHRIVAYEQTNPHVCRAIDRIGYCAYPDYVEWIPLWAQVVQPIVASAPPDARSALAEVRQSPILDPRWPGYPVQSLSIGDGTQGVARVGMSWPGWDRDWFKAQVAAQLVGLTEGRCDAQDQARAVLAIWLANLEDLGWPGDEIGHRALWPAKQLASMPDAKNRVWEHWKKLIDPRTTINDALPLLGLKGSDRAEGGRFGHPCT